MSSSGDPIQFVTGLASGIDWRTTVDQLIAVDHKAVDVLIERKDSYNEQLSAWQDLQGKLLSLRSAVDALRTEDGFKLFTTQLSASGTLYPENILSVSVDDDAVEGKYAIQVLQRAQAQKLSSKTYGSITTSLGLSGEILINGKVLTISTGDSLSDIRDNINSLNTGEEPSGVSASIVQYGTSDYRLILTSDTEGDEGFSLLNASSSDILASLGFSDGTQVIKNSIQGGAKSDTFTSTSTAVGTLLGLSSPQSGTVTIDGANVDIDLSTDSLIDIRDAIVAAGKEASIITETQNGSTVYRLLIETSNLTDSNNVLETLGVLRRGTSDVLGVRGSVANTSGGSAITASTLIKDIDGYTDYASGDTITISGTKHDGTSVGPSTFTITDTTTVGDLLTEIETLFGGASAVDATVTADGKIQLEDLQSGTSQLSLALTPSSSLLSFGEFGSASTLREREIQAGQDAQINVDGVTVTRDSNRIDDLIEGVTLDLLSEDQSVTIYLDVKRDFDAIVEKIEEFVDSYNEVLDWIAVQFTYDVDTGETGGPLFGDSTLRSIRTYIQTDVINQVWGMAEGFEALSVIGIKHDSSNRLVIDRATLTGYLNTNFEEVKALFVAKGTAESGLLEYINHTEDTQAGTYEVVITQPATRTTLTGGNDLTDTLSSSETITITDGSTGRVAEVTLEAGWDLDAVVTAINSELSSVKTEQLMGDNATGYSATTSWSSISGAEDGDLITFSGTDRYGLSVSGSYTVDTSQNLGDLLEAIEDAFNDQVYATLDTQGRLVITDKTAGDSQLTFSIDTSEVSGLDFGTVSVVTEGRYALLVSASRSGDRLLLTHQQYGGHDITATTDAANGGALGLGSYATKVLGQDVAGTINGATATGSGRLLTLNDSGNNANGLSVYYSGSTTLTANFTFTLGVAEMLYQTVDNITDPASGNIYFKTEMLNDVIDNLEERIEDMEERLEQRRQRLIQQFIAMEKSLGVLQSQMSWLTGQISGLNL
jgi:flagellar hook-associated protein 2